VILCRCVHLRRLVIENSEFKGIYQTVLPSFVRSSYPQLTSLTLNGCLLSTDKVYLLLSLTPSLVSLEIISQRSELDSIFDGHLWQQFIQTKLLLLRKFKFFFAYNTNTVGHNSFASIITSFRTPFWLNDKHWFVTCEYVVTSSNIILYTIPVYMADYEILVRYDLLSFDNCLHLSTRHWSNHLEYVETEQVSES
jgi:hypothetical protein